MVNITAIPLLVGNDAKHGLFQGDFAEGAKWLRAGEERGAGQLKQAVRSRFGGLKSPIPAISNATEKLTPAQPPRVLFTDDNLYESAARLLHSSSWQTDQPHYGPIVSANPHSSVDSHLTRRARQDEEAGT